MKTHSEALKLEKLPKKEQTLNPNEWRREVFTLLRDLIDRIGSKNPISIVRGKDGSLRIYEIIAGQRAKNPVFFSDINEADAFLELIKDVCIEEEKVFYIEEE